jgi:hypothetical protein
VTITRRIRETMLPAEQPYIIGVVALASPEYTESSLGAGMDDFLRKPLRAEELRASLERGWQRMQRRATRQRILVVLDGDIAQLDAETRQRLLDEVREKTGDEKSSVISIVPGSILLELDVSAEAAAMLKKLFESGDLKSIGGIPILGIKDHPPETAGFSIRHDTRKRRGSPGRLLRERLCGRRDPTFRSRLLGWRTPERRTARGVDLAGASGLRGRARVPPA